MNDPNKAIDLIFDASIPFHERFLKIFNYQIDRNPVLKRFFESFGLKNSDRPSSKEIPLLPIRGFKDGNLIVESEGKKPDLIFKSSGTSDMEKSTHVVLSKQLYQTAISEEFKKHFPFENYRVLFFLPEYDQNPQSSLIWMAKYLTESDPSQESRFVTEAELSEMNSTLTKNGKKVLLFGAAFGLIDFIESNAFASIKNLEIVETGGMKTHRREMTKTALREALSRGFNIPGKSIHSEYGMCELLSQMYAIGDEWFKAPHWVDITVRDPNNPSRICDVGEEGKLGIIDLSNVYSCPFILTDDRGVMDESGHFKVLGRWNPANMRGCNFLMERE